MSSEFEDTADYVTKTLMDRLSPRLIDLPEGRTMLVCPDGEGGWHHTDVTSPNKAEVLAPKIITQAVQLQTVSAMISYINRFKNPDSLVFADISQNRVLGVIDYHTGSSTPTEATAVSGVPQAKHTRHTAGLTIPFSLEWQTWLASDGLLKPHVEFANFLEENAMDILPLGELHDSRGEIVEDAPSTILELCRELQVKGSYGASSDVRNGDYAKIEMQRGDDVSTKRDISLPVSIGLSIPVYFGEMPVYVTAFLRRKIDNGSLKLGYKLMRPEQARQDEFKRIVSEIEADVGLTTIYGKPA